ncbi:MAG: ATP phosphoribosyltransferase [Clostridia bacterium]|nr:ATP phosphoribosyltransferase [Clostridia bacterium]
MLKIALPKGRLGEKVYSFLAKAGYGCAEFNSDSRKLIFCDEKNGVSYFWVKPADVPVYVELGAAHLGVAGKDVLDESGADVYELSDLNIGKCKICVAAKEGFKDDTSKPLRVATKFVNSAQKYFSSLGREVKIIKLNGSIELAPVLGISDVIFDIVETGATLKENNLKIVAEVSSVSARLFANKTAYKFSGAEITALTRKLEELKND